MSKQQKRMPTDSTIDPKTTAQRPAATRAYRGASASAREAERRQRLLDTALTLFANQGYARTPIEQLCAEAKVTARHFYQLFGSREGLLKSLYGQLMADLKAALLSALSATQAELNEQLPLAVRALVEHYLNDTRRARVGVLEVVGVSADMERLRRAAIHDMANLIALYMAQLAAQGDLPARNYHLTSIAIVGGINELMADWLTASEPPSVAVLTLEISDFLTALVHGSHHLPQREIAL
ncbi:TetR/AcrR family transcriptional regulator [Paraperlucidibaca baekdonensis]|nr:TetR/AcrR family transcriptional regulator [Paraperlucidibaca baekdonensis]